MTETNSAGPALDWEQARRNMIEYQIRVWEVLDPRVLELLAKTAREDFVPQAYRALAFADVPIPLGHGQIMMAPKVEGRLLQALDLQTRDLVLEVGTGSGYLTACLAKTTRRVHSVEWFEDLSAAAGEKLAAKGIDNVTLEVGDAGQGWSGSAPYDVIALTGSVAVLPTAYREALAVGGRLFVIIGQGPIMDAVLITRVGERAWTEEGLFQTAVPALLHTEAEPAFIF